MCPISSCPTRHGAAGGHREGHAALSSRGSLPPPLLGSAASSTAANREFSCDRQQWSSEKRSCLLLIWCLPRKQHRQRSVSCSPCSCWQKPSDLQEYGEISTVRVQHQFNGGILRIPSRQASIFKSSGAAFAMPVPPHAACTGAAGLMQSAPCCTHPP